VVLCYGSSSKLIEWLNTEWESWHQIMVIIIMLLFIDQVLCVRLVLNTSHMLPHLICMNTLWDARRQCFPSTIRMLRHREPKATWLSSIKTGTWAWLGPLLLYRILETRKKVLLPLGTASPMPGCRAYWAEGWLVFSLTCCLQLVPLGKPHPSQ
jgi:hypothetical protein